MEVVVVTTQGVEFREAEQYLPLVSALRRDRIAKKLRDEDKLQALAAGLLLSGERTLAEIADATGYANVHYFSRRFNEYFGEPPGRYRRNHRHDHS